MCFPPREHREVPVPEGVGREAAPGKGFCAAVGRWEGDLEPAPCPRSLPRLRAWHSSSRSRAAAGQAGVCPRSPRPWWWGCHPLSGPVPSEAEMQVSRV